MSRSVPSSWSGHCPFCGHGGTLSKDLNECSECGQRFSIDDPRGIGR